MLWLVLGISATAVRVLVEEARLFWGRAEEASWVDNFCTAEKRASFCLLKRKKRNQTFWFCGGLKHNLMCANNELYFVKEIV